MDECSRPATARRPRCLKVHPFGQAWVAESLEYCQGKGDQCGKREGRKGGSELRAHHSDRKGRLLRKSRSVPARSRRVRFPHFRRSLLLGHLHGRTDIVSRLARQSTRF
jgi:hypothetical protein